MATYTELHDVRNDPDIVRKVEVAIAEVAYDILSPETGATADRTAWAKEAIADPAGKAPGLLHYVLIANKAATVAQIKAATDDAVKTNIATAVTKIVGATV